MGTVTHGATPTELASYGQPHILVAVDRHRLVHLRCEGQGSPTIVLVAGSGDSGLGWWRVFPDLAELSRTCAWDRAGAGFSGPSPTRQDAHHTALDLRRALAVAGLRPPYLLVAHSVGSFEALYFAFKHRSDVAGIVLVDPSVPFQYRRFSAVAEAGADWLRDGLEEQVAGLNDCLQDGSAISRPSTGAGWQDCLGPPPSNYPQEIRDAMQRLPVTAAGVRNMVSLIENEERSSRQVKKAWKDLGDMPLVVLTADKPLVLPPEYASDAGSITAEWRRMHYELSRLSRRGSSRVVADSGHYIQDDHPEAVVEAVAEVLHTAGISSARRSAEK